MMEQIGNATLYLGDCLDILPRGCNIADPIDRGGFVPEDLDRFFEMISELSVGFEGDEMFKHVEMRYVQIQASGLRTANDEH